MKGFLSQRGIPFKEYDVGIDREAALRMIRLSGQQGVPVTTIDDEVIVGFDRRRLEEALAKAQSRKPPLGVAVADATGTTEGAYVGRVTPYSLAEKASLQVGDVIIEIGGQPVRNAVDLERIYKKLHTGSRVALIFLRQGRLTQTELSL
nr:PDZ domain-containing protein [Chloroflexota bacterium]